MRQKDKIQIIITGVLVVVLILAFGNASKKLRNRNMKVKPKATGAPALPISRESKPESKDLYNSLEQHARSIDLKRDPFTASPIVSENSLSSDISLTGILWDPLKPLAIIDGNVVRKGERVGSKVIMDIKRDRVILSDGEVLSELKLEP